MLGMMSGKRVAVTGDLSYNFRTICDSSVRGKQTDINAFACSDKETVTVLLWNYYDLDIQSTGSPVVLSIKGIPAPRATLIQYRIDNEHSNSYEVWKKMGSPQNPTADQITILEKAGRLETLSEPSEIEINNTVATIEIQLPRQAVSLVRISY
jgi:xylan 1,4-beta-xylosidase